MLPAPARLSRREDFALAVRHGRRLAGPGVVLHYAPASQDAAGDLRTRVGFVVGRAVGNAVTRNLIRRRMRHLMAARLDRLPAGSRVVLRATPAVTNRSFAELTGVVDELLARAFGPAA